MKQGETIFIRQQHQRRPVIVIGEDERGAIVDFGEMRFILSSPADSNGRIIIIRAESERAIEMRGPTDVQYQLECYIREEATAPPG